MYLYSIAPYFLVMLLICLLFSLPIFKFLDTEASERGRISTIDGLRGFLALSVMIYHGLINYSYVVMGKWEAPDVLFYRPLGGVAVMFFFMITGYLFWGRLLAKKGNSTGRLYTSIVSSELHRSISQPYLR